MNRIAEHREARGLTQKDLAELVGTDAGTISRYERTGELRLTLGRAVQIADALGVSVNDLIVHDAEAATPQPGGGTDLKTPEAAASPSQEIAAASR